MTLLNKKILQQVDQENLHLNKIIKFWLAVKKF